MFHDQSCFLTLEMIITHIGFCESGREGCIGFRGERSLDRGTWAVEDRACEQGSEDCAVQQLSPKRNPYIFDGSLLRHGGRTGC